LKRALTILLPVRNAESTLVDSVVKVLDAAADTGEKFTVLIIDDASIDSTSELAYDLCRRYPQVRTLRLRRPVGEDAALRWALAQTRGEVVCVRAGCPPIFEPISAKTPLARPNYLDRAKTLASEGRR